MDSYFEISEKQIVLTGVTTDPKRCGHRYIVYRTEANRQTSIHINTEFTRTVGGLYRCCRYYDQKLCDTDEQLRTLSLDSIEAHAYNAWMDGAR